MMSCYITSSKNLLVSLDTVIKISRTRVKYLFIHFCCKIFPVLPSDLSAALFERKKPHVCRVNYIIFNCLLSHILPHDAKKPVGK